MEEDKNSQLTRCLYGTKLTNVFLINSNKTTTSVVCIKMLRVRQLWLRPIKHYAWQSMRSLSKLRYASAEH